VLRALLLLVALLGAAPTLVHASSLAEALVVRVVDGDTIHVRVDGHLEKVRYIGVNTPEVHHPSKGEEPGGREAHAVNRRLVEGKRVRLELDVQSRDRYGRLLAYVYLAGGGREFVNAELVRRGFARTLTIAPNTDYASRFTALQRQAQSARLGLWRACPAGP
jgi:micrococcal nuclease